jgi:maltose alpha-D-glucosyltransferase/alpha-amylase
MRNPQVRAELKKIMAFWLQLGVAGFRMDAVPFIIELTEPGNTKPPMDFEFLTELRQHATWRRGDALLLAEANVPLDQLQQYFADAGGSNNRIQMMFDFILNDAMVLALARRTGEPVVQALRDSVVPPPGGQWATFLRNHDEIDLSRLTAEQRAEVFEQFGPDPDSHLYDRGIRRRLAPMLGGDRRRLELAYSVQFTLRGTPVLRYGEEIGMGDDLSLPGREAIRTPMQWSGLKNAGFTTADKPIRPVVSSGEYSHKKVNVTAQRDDPGSLLAWFERMIRSLRECPEIGSGRCTALDKDDLPAPLLAHRADGPRGSMLFLHNLGEDSVTVDLSELDAEAEQPNQVFGDQPYEDVGRLDQLEVAGYGYRWIRLHRTAS